MNPARLKQLRTERGWTQQELANAVPCSPVTISHFERGLVRRPNRLIAARLAELLDADAPEMSGRPAPPSTTPEAHALAA